MIQRVFDVCNIDGIPKSLIRNCLLGEIVTVRSHPVSGCLVFLKNIHAHHRPRSNSSIQNHAINFAKMTKSVIIKSVSIKGKV